MSMRTEELRAEADRHREAIANDLEMVGDRVSPGRMAERRKAAVRQRVTTVKERVMGAVPTGEDLPSIGDVTGPASEVASSAASAVGDMPQKATRAAQGNPLAAGLIAFGAGLLAATLLPESDQERRLAEKVQPQVDELASGVGDAARQVADEVRPQAQEAVQAVTESAKESATTVRDQAKDATEELKSDAQQQADVVKRDIGPA